MRRWRRSRRLRYSATEQTACRLKNNGLSISDVDAGTGSLTVTLSVDEGTLTVTAGTSGAVVTNSGTSSVTITGTVAQINALLNTNATSTVSYSDNSDTPAASTTLTLSVNDNGNTGGGALIGSDTATINITAVNDAPVIDLLAAGGLQTTATTASFTESGGAITILPQLTLSDVDSPTLSGAAVTLTAPQTGDVLSLQGQAGSSGTLANGIAFSISGAVVTFSNVASLANYQAALHLIQFNNTVVNPSTSDRTFSVQVDDGGVTNNTASATATVTVGSVNHAPIVTVPGTSVAVGEDGILNLTGATATDLDNGDVLTATVGVGQGTLTSLATPGLLAQLTNVSGNGTGLITITGSASAVDAVVTAGVAYAPAANFNGQDQLALIASDNHGANDSKQVTITVNAVNDAPVATITPVSYSATEQTSLSLKNNGLSISDVDAGSGSLTATLSVGEGTLTVTAGTSGAVSIEQRHLVGDGDRDGGADQRASKYRCHQHGQLQRQHRYAGSQHDVDAVGQRQRQYRGWCADRQRYRDHHYWRGERCAGGGDYAGFV